MKIQPINDWLNYYIKHNNSSSIAISIITSEEITSSTYGVYNKEKNINASKDSIYQIASLSKLYTVIEILKLHSTGTLSINDYIVKHLDYFPDRTIKIKDLMTHTAGLGRDGDFNFWLSESFPSEDELIRYVSTLQIENQKEYKYSNLGYAILGLILKKNNISFENDVNESVVGYGRKRLDVIKTYGYLDFKSFTSSFGIYKTIDQLSLFIQQILNKSTDILPEEAWDLLFEVQVEKQRDEDDITLGFRKWKDANIFELDGYGFGFASSILIDFNNKKAYVVLTNSGEETFANYFTRSIRKYIELFENNANFNLASNLNGLYRSKDYDVFVYDCGEMLYLIRPANETPFHEGEIEEYKKIDENKYLITNQEDPYVNEFLSFEFKEETVIGFRQGGWGFTKLQMDLE